jgi:hypothetical protein
MREFLIGFFSGTVFLAAFCIAPSPQDNPDARVYCEMRKIFDDTGGEFGWPNYRSEIECTNGEVK